MEPMTRREPAELTSVGAAFFSASTATVVSAVKSGWKVTLRFENVLKPRPDG